MDTNKLFLRVALFAMFAGFALASCVDTVNAAGFGPSPAPGVSLGGSNAFTGSNTFPDIRSSTYTPTCTNLANAGTISGNVSHWIQVKNHVMVFGSVGVTPTASATQTQISCTFPVASVVTANADVAGTAGGGGVNQAGGVIADTTNHAADVFFISAGNTAITMSFSFSYIVK